ncbi:hypothetical protein MCERE19_00677 [Spirosomataceae bacterium]
MNIPHVSKVNNWYIPEVYKNAKTLILGSFNPYNQDGKNADYYYGRETNYFWRVIGHYLHSNENFYINNLDEKINIMLDKKFCFYDVIQSIDVISNDDDALYKFVHQKIFIEFSDQVLFTTNTKYNIVPISVFREYNQDVFELLAIGNIEKVIHTMGNSRIKTNFDAKPNERSLGINGFQGYLNQILKHNISFQPISLSPSMREVRKGGDTYFNSLTNWLVQNLDL